MTNSATLSQCPADQPFDEDEAAVSAPDLTVLAAGGAVDVDGAGVGDPPEPVAEVVGLGAVVRLPGGGAASSKRT